MVQVTRDPVHFSASSWFGSRHSSFSDSSCNMSGAAEHSFYMTKGCVANINVGLPGKANRGSNWNEHRRVLLDIFVKGSHILQRYDWDVSVGGRGGHGPL